MDFPLFGGARRRRRVRPHQFFVRVSLAFSGTLVLGLSWGCGADQTVEAEGLEEGPATLRVVGGTDVDRGRYLAVIGGCNDCHTDGYLQSGGQVPEEQWLSGSPVGWRGPWGTTYASNLRLTVQSLGEDEWVSMLRTRTDRPPMPWMNVSRMSEADMRALYRYLRDLGPNGAATPPALPPEAEPTTPYTSLFPVLPGS